ncbi:MAG: DUF6049 family protein [Nakamurella sp.]
MRFGRLAAMVGAVLMLMLASIGPAAAALAAVTSSTISVQTAAPFGDYVGRLSFDVTSIDPALVTATGPSSLTITGTMSNAGPEGLTDLAYRFQRGSKLANDADVRRELAQPDEPTEQIQNSFTKITDPVPAGAAIPFSFTASITGPDGLAITTPGVYPLMVNVNGAVVLPDGPLGARIGELHLLLTVMGVPATGAVDGAGSPAVTNPVQTNPGTPLPVNLVWPVVDRPHLGVGGVFLDEDLLAAISPGGRLSTLVDGLLDPSTEALPVGAVTVVLDPELLDELDRMTTAYRVVADPGTPQPSLADIVQAEQTAAAGPAQTAATNTPAAPAPVEPGSANIAGTVAGTGQGAAASFLGRLRDAAARYQVLLLPYGDPDVVAMVRAELDGEVSQAVQHGNDVAKRVLGSNPGGGTSVPPPATVMAYPINGAVDIETLAALRGDGLASALLAENSVDPSNLAAGAAQVSTADGETPASSERPLQAAIAQPDVLNGVGTLIDQGRQSGYAMRVNALTGVLAQGSLDGGSTPAVFTPDRRWSPDAPGLKVLTDLMSTLSASQVITGIGLTDLANSGTAATVPDYPDAAREQELSAEYLGRVRSDRENIASLRKTLASASQSTDPALVLDPLDQALDSAGSTAFRTDPGVGTANLDTVESTLAGIRNGVEISSAGNSYTLASSSSPLVLTVQNNLPYDVPVRVEITGGERVGLTVSDPGLQVVPAGRSQQVKIPAEVSRSGQFQVGARLVGPDGTQWGQAVQLSVESTAYGALTVIIILVAGGVLVLMIVLRIIQRLRGKPDQTPGLELRGEQTTAADPTRSVHFAGPPDPARPVDPADPSRTTGLLAQEPVTGTRSTDPAEHVGTDRP